MHKLLFSHPTSTSNIFENQSRSVNSPRVVCLLTFMANVHYLDSRYHLVADAGNVTYGPLFVPNCHQLGGYLQWDGRITRGAVQFEGFESRFAVKRALTLLKGLVQVLVLPSLGIGYYSSYTLRCSSNVVIGLLAYKSSGKLIRIHILNLRNPSLRW